MYKVLFKRLYSHTYTHVDRHACSYTVWKDSQVRERSYFKEKDLEGMVGMHKVEGGISFPFFPFYVV